MRRLLCFPKPYPVLFHRPDTDFQRVSGLSLMAAPSTDFAFAASSSVLF